MSFFSSMLVLSAAILGAEEPTVSVTALLAGGTTSVGRLMNADIVGSTLFESDLRIPAAAVSSVEFFGTNADAWVKLADGSDFRMNMNAEEFEIESGLGVFKLKPESVRTMQFRLHPASLSDGVASTNGLVGWWRFDGDCKDSSGNGNDGENIGVEFVPDRRDNLNGAASFDGHSSVLVNDSPSLFSVDKEITVSVWLKPTEWERNDWVSVLCKSDDTSKNGSYRFQIYSHFGQHRSFGRFENRDCTHYDLHGFDDTGRPASPCCSDVHALRLGEWQHVAVSFDGKCHRVYRNGELVSALEFTSKIGGLHDRLRIGLDIVGANDYYHGLMDDLRLYNRALSEEEILVLFEEK